MEDHPVGGHFSAGIKVKVEKNTKHVLCLVGKKSTYRNIQTGVTHLNHPDKKNTIFSYY
jgi:hypothetical protein